MIPLCRDQGVGVIPWSPLARGRLTGNRTRDGETRTRRSETDRFAPILYTDDADDDIIERNAELAARRGVPPAQTALAWVLGRPGVTAPIVGATSVRHVEDALAAERLSLDADEVASLDELYRPHPVAGH